LKYVRETKCDYHAIYGGLVPHKGRESWDIRVFFSTPFLIP
jgi:hypothetical protein